MSAQPCKRFFTSVAMRGHLLCPARAVLIVRLALPSSTAASVRRPASPSRCGMKSRTYPRKFMSGGVLRNRDRRSLAGRLRSPNSAARRRRRSANPCLETDRPASRSTPPGAGAAFYGARSPGWRRSKAGRRSARRLALDILEVGMANVGAFDDVDHLLRHIL